ncbi:MAG: competence protein ComFB [Candidatus Muiribacterium halophilum]|uniref:Competence protein ComFB n=1 Tax=Muiribacterium halophilum TaxID=2053465 RepID=A0A2N5ZID1_MUIH1|nr:MAG: competence protein ComFB [Candidatus Muirbacterium halophilum]
MKYELKNVMEELVQKKTDELLGKDTDICSCERCRLDIMALVLNKLPVKYVVSTQGEAYTKLEFLRLQYKVDIITEIIQAMELVKKQPNH